MKTRYKGIPPRLLGAVFIVAAVLWSPVLTAQDYVVIVNRKVPDTQISALELKNIFLAKKKSWSNGKKIRISQYKRGALQDKFLKEAVSKSRKKFEIYWKKLVFTGKAPMPRRVTSEAAVVTYVESTPGTIGFVSAKADIGESKVLKVVP